MAAAPLLLGAGFVAIAGGKAMRNLFMQDDKDVKNPESHTNRMDGIANRLVANPRLLEQYNEKYIEKKLENNSALRRSNSSKQIQRTRSQEIAKRASFRDERETHLEKVAGA